MIRTKVILVFATSLILIVALLGIHIYETSKEEYLYKRIDTMHHEYVLVMEINHLVSSQVKETMSGIVLGFSEEQSERYDKVKRLAETTINNLVGSVSDEFDYIEVEETEQQEIELLAAKDLLDKYAEIDNKLALVKELARQSTGVSRGKEILIEVEGLYASFEILLGEWLGREREERQKVESTFAVMTSKNNKVLIVGATFCILFALTMSVSIIVLIIDPRMKELISGTERIAKGELETPIVLSGKDEFTLLSRAFNQMMKRLENSQKKLLEQSYHSGMAEIVSGILHNIKNAFSPFIIDTEIIFHYAKDIKLSQLELTIAELQDDSVTADRKKDLLDLSALLLTDTHDILRRVTDKIAAMQNRATLIERIIEDQSRLANSPRLVEEVSLYELIRDSLALIKKGLLGKVLVVIDNDVAAIGSIRTQRIVLLQIFSNIIINAIEAIIRSENKSGKVHIRAECAYQDDKEMIHVTITDTGDGIKSEMLNSIFQRGISSKSKKSGLGLHWCANSISALHGRIYAESDGEGTGSCFHLYLRRDV